MKASNSIMLKQLIERESWWTKKSKQKKLKKCILLAMWDRLLTSAVSPWNIFLYLYTVQQLPDREPMRYSVFPSLKYFFGCDLNLKKMPCKQKKCLVALSWVIAWSHVIALHDAPFCTRHALVQKISVPTHANFVLIFHFRFIFSIN